VTSTSFTVACSKPGSSLNETLLMTLKCGPDEYCVDHYYSKSPSFATCAEAKQLLIWKNDHNPENQNTACSNKVSYETNEAIITSMNTYTMDGKPGDTLYQYIVFENAKQNYNEHKHNTSYVVSDYSRQYVQYCFGDTTRNTFIAYAGAWFYY
jgi:hypothetical protein